MHFVLLQRVDTLPGIQEMKHSEDRISKIESVTTIIVNFGTIAAWLFSFFTVIVLNIQPQPISLPGVVTLGAGYKLLFLVSIFLAYFQLLKRSWEQQKRHGKDVEGTFGSYIYGSTIKGKRPLVSIGFVALLGIILGLIFTQIIWFAIILCFGFLVGGAALSDADLRADIKRHFDDEYRKRWLRRIRDQLHTDGRSHSGNFMTLPDVTLDEINWAIKMYFEMYEFEQRLAIDDDTVEHNSLHYTIYELRFRHVPSILRKAS